MTRVGYIIDTIESPTAGTEKHLLQLIENLNRRLFEPHLFVLYSSPWLESEFKSCPVHCLDLQFIKRASAVWKFHKFCQVLKNLRIDLIQTHFVDGNTIGCLAGRVARIKTVSSRRNQGYWHTGLNLLLLKTTNRWVDHFLANCNDTKNWVIQAEGLPANKISVIHNGVDLSAFAVRGPKTERREFRRQLGFPVDCPIVGIVANLRPVKALNVFLDAAALLSKRVPDCRFIIVGEGTERANLEKTAQDLGLNRTLAFLGARKDVPEILANIDIAALTSNSESFSNSVVEYLAAGLPVVATDVGGCREAVESGDNGFLVACGEPVLLADRLEQIIRDNLVESMGRKSRRKAESIFSLAAMMNRYEDLYARLAEGPRKFS